jgi:hypothetical protein
MLEAPYEAEDAKSRHKNSATKACPSNQRLRDHPARKTRLFSQEQSFGLRVDIKRGATLLSSVELKYGNSLPTTCRQLHAPTVRR